MFGIKSCTVELSTCTTCLWLLCTSQKSSSKSPSTKTKTTFLGEKTEKLITLCSEEEVHVLCNCWHKEYFSGEELPYGGNVMRECKLS